MNHPLYAPLRPDTSFDPYGVPAGSVPRLNPATLRPFVPTSKYAPKPDPIAQAVDDYLLMERKARAWDEVRAHIVGSLRLRHLDADCGEILDLMDRLVHPAQEPSTR